MTNKTTVQASRISLRTVGAGLLLALALAPAAACVSGTIEDPVGAPNDEDVATVGMTWEEFLSVIYQEPDTGIYIVNGDTPIEGYRELQQFYYDYVQQGELIINQAGGVDTKWSAAQQVNITYCISSSSFGTKYSTVQSAMSAAAGAWQAAANVKFVYSSGQDSNCTVSNNNVVFNVRLVNVNGQYLARSFFPNSTRSGRELLIDQTAFNNISPWTLAGVLRHELGHTLGFRHEHTRPEAATCFEDNSWRALTTYDSASVMHYPQCNGTQTGDLVLTQKDKDGVASIYGAPGGGGGSPPPTCAHDKCATGTALNAAACGSVVQSVCNSDNYCCTTGWDSQCVNEVYSLGGSVACGTGTCAHSLCSAGTKLTKGCDPNGVVTAVCNADAYCCNTQWDSICVGEVNSKAGKTCN